MIYPKGWSSLSDERKKIITEHQSEFPIKIGALAKAFDITVKKSTLDAGVSGEIKKVNGKIVIRVNRHDVKERQRFTLAHEIAHYLLHEDKIGDGIVDDILYRSNLSDDLEAQANRLAADIIMPWTLIKKTLDRCSDLTPDQKIEKLATEAKVSPTAAKIRVGKMNMVSHV